MSTPICAIIIENTSSYACWPRICSADSREIIWNGKWDDIGKICARSSLRLNGERGQVEEPFHFGVDVLYGFWTDPLDVANSWSVDPSSPRVAVYRCSGPADEPALIFEGIEDERPVKIEDSRPRL